MEFTRLMTIRRKLALLSMTLLTSVFLVAPAASAAINVEFGHDGGGGFGGSDLSDQCGDVSDGLGGALGCEASDKVIDFTQFEGELEGPDAAGYDDALTQTTDARDFIQTIVNFALSFLGLVAVVVVIYGGILYVLSRGDEEMVSKGKSAMTYAMMGIIIILGSFALVNTLIGATGGGNNGTIAGGGAPGTTIDQAGAAFDSDGVLREIESIVQEYIQNYQTYTEVASSVSHMLSLEVPYTVEVDFREQGMAAWIETAGAWLSGLDKNNMDNVIIEDAEHMRQFTNGVLNDLADIQGEVDPFSATYEAAQNLIDFMRSSEGSDFLSALTVPQDTVMSRILDSISEVAYAATDLPGFLQAMSQQGLNAGTCSDGLDEDSGEYSSPVKNKSEGGTKGAGNVSSRDKSGIAAWSKYDADIDILKGTNPTCEGVYDVYEALVNDYYEKLNGDLVERAEDLKALFETRSAGGSSLEDLNVAANNLYMAVSREKIAMDNAGNSPIDRGSVISSGRLRSVVSSADEFYALVENIQFVNVRMTASTTRGNAPLIVNFDALGTEDPSGETVENGRIQWDLNGDGSFFPDDIGPAATHTYSEAGTYRVRLKVYSSDPNIAAGLATMTIVVEPPKSQLVLGMRTGVGTDEVIIADHTQFPAIDSSSAKVTMAEAKEGVTFDASRTLDGDGNSGGAGGIIRYEWDFGDNTVEAGAFDTHKSVTHLYGEEGAYDVSLTVTDSTGVEDRKVFKLFVASPAARVSCLPSTVAFGQSIKCDGSQSSADIGSIVRYDWNVTDEDGPVDISESTGSSVNMQFDDPGVYDVALTITDSSGVNDTASTKVVVESRQPVARFNVSAPEAQIPGIRVFDASDSYDPDEADEITFEWEIDAEEGEDYDIIEGDDDEETMTVEFLNTGDYEVSLTVADQHEGELQKTDEFVELIAVPSILDVELEVQGDPTRFLDDDGEVVVNFTALSNNASFFEIDYDDGNTDATQSIRSGEADFVHTYTSAGVYNVTLLAEDEAGNRNQHRKKIYISPGDEPIAVIELTAEGEDIGVPGDFTGNVNTIFRFNANSSVNIDGSASNLKYSWNFGDGSTSSQPNVTHSFDELATYTVTLTVRDKTDPSLESQETVDIRIKGLDPVLRGMTVVPQGDSLETPLQVNVSVDAQDQDGSVVFYKGWLYALDDSATEIGTVVSQSPNFSLTVNTKGEEGEEVEYGFEVEVTDNDNNSVTLDQSKHPSLRVVNGPNENPVASFSVDRTSIFLGESLVINDTSYDPDGDIENIWVDIEGNGFYDNDPLIGTSMEWTPTQVYPDGVPIKVKVEDNAGATDISDTVRVYVDAVTAPPEAAFLTTIDGKEVRFANNSKLDEGVSLQGVFWDININEDSDGDGDSANDIDYLEENFTHSYPELGMYQVRFTVVDETGQSDAVTLDVNVVDAEDPVAEFAYSVVQMGETEVDFRNGSRVDEANDLTVRSYAWDFDLNEDSNGDDDPENDIDSTGRSPNHDYEAFGKFQVRLTVVDSFGQKDSITKEVFVPNPVEPVEAVLTTVPQPNANKQVILSGSEGDVSFYFSANGGSGKYSYEIDKNIFFDTDGDGIRENDADHEAMKSGSWKTQFFSNYGQTVVKLTVTDLETGESSVATIQVVFQGSFGAANLFNATPSEMMFLILSALLAAIGGTALVFRNQITANKS